MDDSLEEETAKNYANKILENLSDDVKSYYDIQVLVDSDNEESEVYPIIGYKHKTTDMFVWKQ